MLFNKDLLTKHHVPNIFPRLTDIRSSTQHKLVSDNSDGEVIHSATVILSAHDLRSHVTRCTGSVLRILRLPNLGNSHVCYAQVAILFHNYIFWLNIPMNYTLRVHVLEPEHHACDHELGFIFPKSSSLTYMVAQIATCQQITD